MTADQVGNVVDRRRLDAYFILNGGYGFGLGGGGPARYGGAGMMGTAGDFHWGGGTGRYFWVDPKKELVVVAMTGAPPSRQRQRQMLPALVLQAIVD